ncbi:MAG: copper homeostasis protein CutC [Culicoidibacterales bacterium]
MFIEVIATSVDDYVLAASGGADRVELVSAMEKDGLSPNEEVIRTICEQISIPIRVMVRFHNDSFVYSTLEVAHMCEWIQSIHHLPIEGFVIGGLTPDGMIDTYLLDEVTKVINGKKLTFHRAFDVLTPTQQLAALNILRRYPIDTILTSGGLIHPIAENLHHLQELAFQANDMTILLGGGVNQTLLQHLNDFPTLQAIHIGSASRANGDFHQPIVPSQIRNFK